MKKGLISALTMVLAICQLVPAQFAVRDPAKHVEGTEATLAFPPAYRGGRISWQRDLPSFTSVTFTVEGAFRLSDLGPVQIFGLVDVGSDFNFGDGSPLQDVRLRITAIIPADDVVYGTLVLPTGQPLRRNYAATGTYEAYWEGANRLPTATNFATNNWRSETTVRLDITTTSSSSSSIVPVVYLQDNNVGRFTVPLQSHDNNTTTPTIGVAGDFIATPTDPFAPMAPTGMAINSFREVTWDIRNSIRPEVVPNQTYYVGLTLSNNNGTLSPVEFLVVVIPDTNQTPVNYMPGPQMVARNGTLTFGSSNYIYIDDPDGQGGNITTTLRVLNGTLTLSGTDGLIFSNGDGVGDATMTMTGTPTSVVNAMFGMTYRPTPEYAGSDTFTLITNDNGNTGGPPMSDTDSFQILVLAPTATNVSISGRAMTEDGRSIAGAVIQLQRTNGEVRSTRTNTFGYYRFNDIPAGESVVISAVTKRHQFALPVRMIHAIDNMSGVDFIANP